MFCWAPGEVRGSQGLENKLCSTAGWALPHCRCSFHNSPEVRRARRGRRERGAQQAEGEHSHTTQPTAALRQGRARPLSACTWESYMEARGWRGAPVCRETVNLHLGVQLLADRLVSTQLTSSEAGKKMGSMDDSHPGRQLRASTDNLPHSGLSQCRSS